MRALAVTAVWFCATFLACASPQEARRSHPESRGRDPGAKSPDSAELALDPAEAKLLAEDAEVVHLTLCKLQEEVFHDCHPDMTAPGSRRLVETGFFVLDSGEVQHVATDRLTLDKSLAACVRAHVKTWAFPKLKSDAVLVRHPFIFEATQRSDEGRTGHEAQCPKPHVGPSSKRALSLQEAIHQHVPEVRDCYHEALKRGAVRGQIVVKFVVSGTPASVESATIVRSTVGDPELDRCVVEQVRNWHFPNLALDSGTVVTYPFTFVN